jgi:hypothetical protein
MRRQVQSLATFASEIRRQAVSSKSLASMTFLSLRAFCFGSLPPGGASARVARQSTPTSRQRSSSPVIPEFARISERARAARRASKTTLRRNEAPERTPGAQEGGCADEYDEFKLSHGSTLLFSAETKDSWCQYACDRLPIHPERDCTAMGRRTGGSPAYNKIVILKACQETSVAPTSMASPRRATYARSFLVHQPA